MDGWLISIKLVETYLFVRYAIRPYLIANYRLIKTRFVFY